MDQRNFFRTELHTEVSAGNHDAVGDVDDVGERSHRFGALDLRDDGYVPSQGLGLSHVVGRPHEGQGNVVRLEHGDRKSQVVPVFVGHCGRADRHPWQIQALVVGKRPAVFDHRVDRAALDAVDAEANEAVIQCHGVTGLHIGRERSVCHRDDLLAAFDVSCREREPVTP